MKKTTTIYYPVTTVAYQFLMGKVEEEFFSHNNLKDKYQFLIGKVEGG